MVFNKGLPRDNGATDYMDSARLAGLLNLFDHPKAPGSLITRYMVDDGNGNLVGVRNPDESPSDNWRNFTRDQMMLLAAGLKAAGKQRHAQALLDGAIARGNRAQNTEADVPGSTKKFPDGADLLSPSAMNQLRLCAGQKPTLLGKVWLVVDIVFTSVFTPMAEPNQLMGLCKVAGPGYVKLFRKLNRKLDASIRSYWAGWRGEPELAEFLVNNFR